MFVVGVDPREPAPVPVEGLVWASVVQPVEQAAESFEVEVDSLAAASALARLRAFFAFCFSALARAGARFASVA